MVEITYRRFYNHKRRYKEDYLNKPVTLERHHAHGDTFYMPDPERFGVATGPEIAQECNLDKDDYRDGVQLRWELVPPDVTVKNYTHDVPMDKRRICETCKSGGVQNELDHGHYRMWCSYKAVWNTEYHELQDNLCREWLQKNQDCIG